MKPKPPHPLLDLPTATSSFFLDSGAHSLYTREVIDKDKKIANFKTGLGKYAYYESDEFWAYCDSYAGFLKRFGWAVDHYVNVDTIFSPELTWKTQQYLEQKHGLNPVPVIHYGTDWKWITHYMERGYKFLGIGGLGQEVTKDQYFSWADRAFDLMCPASNGKMPLVKAHGFAMTSWDLMRRYPWWSVDSASWIKASAFGQIYVPHQRKGKFVYDVQPYSITVSRKSPNTKEKNKHIETVSPGARAVMCAWLEHLGIALGSYTTVKGEMVEQERGVLTHHKPRAEANLRYFMGLAASVPPWPWAFEHKLGSYPNLPAHVLAARSTVLSRKGLLY